ncbi:MAG: hypothetical protein Satyrvirus20_14 [Satyrvirus sp.]|uniref:Uncharacterized protein n=1 Tax=Satyrvirus sp. TaxID=2487771 RepID=A0A3G5AEA4_9VIRU|nr:MAG: hypothetical protein Satyrvirus20_14 [Satyrvirus sp.]
MNKEKTVPYDVENFKNEILDQVRDRSNKLSFIDIDFGSGYNNNNMIEKIDFNLGNEKMKKMSNMVMSEKIHPNLFWKMDI